MIPKIKFCAKCRRETIHFCRYGNIKFDIVEIMNLKDDKYETSDIKYECSRCGRIIEKK